MSAKLNQHLETQTNISVIVCTHNRCDQLKVVLNSLLGQITSKSCQYEIIIVDNNSDDKTKDVVNDYKARFNGVLRYEFESDQGLSFARNKGIKESKGTIIAFTDDDCIIDKKWIQTIYKSAKEIDFNALGGRVLPEYPSNTPSWIKANADLIQGPVVRHDYGEETKNYTQPMRPIVGANMAFKREIFDKYGLFRTDLGVGQGAMGEDTEFYHRIAAADADKIYYCGKALVWHPALEERMTLKYIARWNIAYGKYCAVKKGEVEEKNMVSFRGVPRYLIRKVLKRTLQIVFSCFHKRSFLFHWVNLFREIGTIKAYREYVLSGNRGN